MEKLGQFPILALYRIAPSMSLQEPPYNILILLNPFSLYLYVPNLERGFKGDKIRKLSGVKGT